MVTLPPWLPSAPDGQEPEAIDESDPPGVEPEDVEDTLDATLRWWREWGERLRYDGRDRASVLRRVDGVLEILSRGPEYGIYALCVDSLGATVPECRIVLRCSADELVMKDRSGITPDLVGIEWCARLAGSIS